jgi:hypothetical protein
VLASAGDSAQQVFVHVDAGNAVTGACKHRSGGQADISKADDGNVHGNTIARGISHQVGSRCLGTSML